MREHARVEIGMLVILSSSAVSVDGLRDGVDRTGIGSVNWTAAMCICSEYSSHESMGALELACSRSSAAAW